MQEMEDYSGPFKTDLTFEDFSKEFLLKLMNVWQFAWIRMAGAWYDLVKEKCGFDIANQCNLEAWERVARQVNPRYAKIANIQLNTVLDSLKCLQLPLDNNIGPLYPVEYEIINPNHVIMTIVQCRSLVYYEKEAPEMIQPVCYDLEEATIKYYLMNPKIEVTALKLPPRDNPEEIACKWEIKLQE